MFRSLRSIHFSRSPSLRWRSFSTVPLTEPLPGVPAQHDTPSSPPLLTSSHLPNGIRLTTLASHAHPIATIGLFIQGGSRGEDTHTLGSSFVLRHLAFQKTQQRLPVRLVRDLEALGGDFHVVLSKEYTLYQAAVLGDKVEQLVPLLADILNPQIEEYIVKESIEAANNSLNTSSDDILQLTEALHAEAFRNSPLGNPLFPSHHILSRVNVSTVEETAARNRNSEKMVFVGLGNVSHERFAQTVSNAFKDFKGSKQSFPRAAYVGGDARLIGEPEWTNLMIGFPGGQTDSKDFIVLELLKSYLGESFVSFSTPSLAPIHNHLFERIVKPAGGRFEGVAAVNSEYSDNGLFTIFGRVKGGQATSFVEALTKELSSLYNNFDAASLARAKARCKANFSTMSKQEQLCFIGNRRLFNAKHLTPSQLTEAVDSITAEEVKEVAKRTFKAQPTIVSSGDVSNIPTAAQVKSAL